MKVEYSSNNSGGSLWLSDEDWSNLENNGWTVKWKKDEEYCKKWLDDDGRYLGCLATSAWKEFLSIDCAIAEWEHITRQNAEDEGCECCGSPHYFSEKWRD